MTIELQRNVKNALYHASMASRDKKKKPGDEPLSIEEQIISDFLLTFNAACYNVKYLISHSLQLQKLDEEANTQSPKLKAYYRHMIKLDEESLRNFLKQLKRRIYLFNRTMKIQK